MSQEANETKKSIIINYNMPTTGLRSPAFIKRLMNKGMHLEVIAIYCNAEGIPEMEAKCTQKVIDELQTYTDLVIGISEKPAPEITPACSSDRNWNSLPVLVKGKLHFPEGTSMMGSQVEVLLQDISIADKEAETLSRLSISEVHGGGPIEFRLRGHIPPHNTQRRYAVSAHVLRSPWLTKDDGIQPGDYLSDRSYTVDLTQDSFAQVDIELVQYAGPAEPYLAMHASGCVLGQSKRGRTSCKRLLPGRSYPFTLHDPTQVLKLGTIGDLRFDIEQSEDKPAISYSETISQSADGSTSERTLIIKAENDGIARLTFRYPGAKNTTVSIQCKGISKAN